MILDHYDDDGRYLRVAFAERGVPALIKTAADVSKAKVKFAEDFALPEKMKYPISDAGNTVASTVYFSQYGNQLEPEDQVKVASALSNALDSFGFSVPSEITKAASIQLGYSGEGKDIALEKLFGVPDRDMTVLKDAFDGQTPRGKSRIMFQVKEAGVSMGALADSYASDEFGTDLGMAIKMRELRVSSDEQKERLQDLHKVASSMSPGAAVKWFERFDVDNQLVHLYGKYVPDPYQSVYGRSLEKSAEAKVLFNGEHITASALKEKLSSKYDKISDSFGKEAADQLMSDPATVFNSLPMPQKMAIQKMLS